MTSFFFDRWHFAVFYIIFELQVEKSVSIIQCSKSKIVFKAVRFSIPFMINNCIKTQKQNLKAYENVFLVYNLINDVLIFSHAQTQNDTMQRKCFHLYFLIKDRRNDLFMKWHFVDRRCTFKSVKRLLIISRRFISIINASNRR